MIAPSSLQRHLIAWNMVRGGIGDFGTRPDGIRDDDGVLGNRTKEAIKAFQRAYGMEETGIQNPELGATLRHQVSRLDADVNSLGLRALAVALKEWVAGIKEEPMGSNGGPRIAEYFAVCERDGKPVKIRSGEWCAASASWCVKQALARSRRNGEEAPHGFRVSGVEIQRDLEESGAWVAAEYVRKGLQSLIPGDLVILSRSGAWTRHVCRLVAWKGDTIWTLGGNESNRWMLTPRKLSDAQLLGFGSYPHREEKWTQADKERVSSLCPGTRQAMVSEAVCR